MAATAAGFTSDLKTVTQAGFAPGIRVNTLENLVSIASCTAANDRVAVFTLTKPTLVFAAYVRPAVAAGAAITGSVGLVTSEDGSATTLAGEMALNGTVGTTVYASVDAPVLVPANSQVVLELSASAAGAGSTYVGLVCADVG